MSLLSIETSIKSHLVSIVFMGLLIFGGVYGTESLVAKHDAQNDAKWSAILSTAQAKSASDEAQFQVTLAQITAQNTQLAQAITQRDAALAAIVKADATLTAAQTAIKLGGTTIDPNSVTLPLDTARNLTAQVDSIPVLKANLVDETKIAQGLQTALDSQTTVVTDLKTQLVDSDKACKAQVADVKAKARKSKLKWFGIGFIAGLIGGHAAGL